MKILIYDRIDSNKASTHIIHLMEVSNNLSRLGHKVIYSDLNNSNKNITFKRLTFVESLKYLEFRRFLLSLAIIIRSGKPDIIYSRHGGIFNTGYILAKLIKVPLIKEVNGLAIDEIKIWKTRNIFILKALELIERVNLHNNSRIVAVTDKLKEILVNEYGIEENKICVIQNGANTEMFKPMPSSIAKEKLNLDINKKYICYVGSLSPHQGLEYFIKCMPYVFESVPNVQVLIVGYGGMEQEIKDLVEKIGAKNRFTFTGSVAYEKVPLYINSSDICIVPKKPWRIGYSPLKLHEYMACGKPVIATRTDGFSDLEKQNAGLLVDIENKEEFSNAIIRLLKDEKLGNLMGLNGRNYVIANHSWANVAKKISELCFDAIDENLRIK